jgi:Pilus assembly protein, PilP
MLTSNNINLWSKKFSFSKSTLGILLLLIIIVISALFFCYKKDHPQVFNKINNHIIFPYFALEDLHLVGVMQEKSGNDIAVIKATDGEIFKSIVGDQISIKKALIAKIKESYIVVKFYDAEKKKYNKTIMKM